MADLGAISRPSKVGEGARLLIMFPAHVVSDVKVARPSNGSIGGSVTESGTSVPNVRVFVIWRPSGKVIGTTFTDENGAWEIHGFDPTDDRYCVIIQDPEGGTAYNDAIYALIAPVA